MSARVCPACGVETTAAHPPNFCARCGGRFPSKSDGDGDAVLFPPPSGDVPFAVAVPSNAAAGALYPPVYPPTAQAPYQPTPLKAQPTLVSSYNAADDSIAAVDKRALFGERNSRRGSSSSSSDEGVQRSSKGSFLRTRYTDHPNCDLCTAAFDLTKRRHQWYVWRDCVWCNVLSIYPSA